MKPKVVVTVNGRRKSLFLGLNVRHAIGWQATKAVREGRAEVRDGGNNLVDLEAALHDGQELSVRYPAGPTHLAHGSAQRASAQQMQSRLERLQERLLEDESVRSDLTDDEAQPLIDWGLARCATLTASTGAIVDDEKANELLREPMRRVLAVMRAINSFVSEKDNMVLTAAEAELGSVFQEAGAEAQAAAQPACTDLATGKNSLTNEQMVRRLVALADQVWPAS